MNFVFFLMVVISMIVLTVVSPDSAFGVMLSGARKSIELALSLFAIYSIWLSILEIMDKIGLNKLLNKLFRPINKRLFKGENDKALEFISLNLSANLLGMGSAATPMGIKAMEHMSDGSEKASDNMALFMIINATSIQLVPATVIGMRLAAGSASASDIILPSVIATLISTVCGVTLAKLCAYISRKFKKNKPAAQPAPLFSVQKRSLLDKLRLGKKGKSVSCGAPLNISRGGKR
ncbi:MAG: spore maturation protein [Clostridia bacterium]|nr:spore maturation protein [Clostridia bacterium]